MLKTTTLETSETTDRCLPTNASSYAIYSWGSYYTFPTSELLCQEHRNTTAIFHNFRMKHFSD